MSRRIQVNDNNVERALSKLKKILTENGKLQEVRDRQEYVKPTIKRKLARNQAKRRWEKFIRSQQLPPRQY